VLVLVLVLELELESVTPLLTSINPSQVLTKTSIPFLLLLKSIFF